MGFSNEYAGGPLVIDGDKVKIFTKSEGVNGSYTYISCGGQVASASWVGDEIFVQLQGGGTRQYSTTGTYH